MSFKTIRDLTKRVSIRLRLTLLFVLIFGGSLIGFSIVTFEFFSHALEQEFDDALYNYAVDVTESITLDPSGDLALVPPQLDRYKIYPFSLGTALILIRHRAGGILEQVGEFGELEIPYRREIERLAQGEDPVYRTLTRLDGLPLPEADSYRVITISIDNATPPILMLQIAVPMTLLENQLANRKLALEFGIPFTLLLAGLAAYFLSSRALNPVSGLIRKSREIGVSNLSERLPLPQARDEVRTLAETLNQMIERLENAFLSQERFIADASHQLLSPLTILKGEIEQAIRQGHAKEIELKSFLQETDRLAKLVQDLLLLARVDAGPETLGMAPLELEDVILEAIARAEKSARPRGTRISFNILNESGESRQVRGEEDLLMHLVLNLLENAIKYSPDGSTIQVILNQWPERQELTVADEGPGIPPEELDKIFARFYRGRSKKEQTRPGYGLGLAIARQIAKLHDARIWAENLANPADQGAGARFHFEIKNL